MTSTPTHCTFPGCTKLLSSKYNLKRHIENCHRGYRPHECSICFKRFSSKQNKLEHVRMEHSYSQTINLGENIKLKGIQEEIKIPMLSSIIKFSLDLDLRPFAKIRKNYMFPFNSQDLILPQINPSATKSLKLPPIP